ncbi:MAG: tetratricopeptide repeat protein, partial [Steroidobacteraceae bacterium]
MTTPTPSIRTMAESLVVTAGQAIKHGVASDDVYRYRLATCFSCEQFNHKSRRCGKCGCFMAAKARIAG